VARFPARCGLRRGATHHCHGMSWPPVVRQPVEDRRGYRLYACRTAASYRATRSCPTAGRLRIAEWPRQSIKRVFRIIPLVRQILRVQKSFVDHVPQLAGSKFMKFTDDPALKLVSGPVAHAGCDDGLCDLRPSPDRFDEFPVHPRRQMSRICWASSRGSFRPFAWTPRGSDIRIRRP
jgi:hypothetical protein